MKIQYLRTPKGVLVMHYGRSKSISSEVDYYETLVDALAAGRHDQVVKLVFAVEKSVEDSTLFAVENGNVTTKDGYEDLPQYISQRLREHSDNNIEVKSIENFWNKLKQNPDKDCRETLLDFMERNRCPLTLFGDVVMWKGLRQDYYDQYTGNILMSIGSVIDWDVLFPNNPAVIDRSSECGTSGFHCGSLSYSRNYGVKCVEVIVNPIDILTVPESVTSWKLRTRKFKVYQDNSYSIESDVPYVINIP